VQVTGADQGYLQIQDPHGDEDAPLWWMAHAFSPEELDRVRANLSRGILAEAIATGRTIRTPSALLDPRFRARASVQVKQIGAVLCIPIEQPPLGALYLQGGSGSDHFTDDAVRAAELFARQFAPFADRLLARRRTPGQDDPTRELRAQLRTEGVVGSSPVLAAVLRQVALVAPLDVSLLLTGESGTGKSQLARLIHDNGPRAREPFVEINCAAIPESLVESELFGAMPGAHSTATKRQAGKVAAAEHGTLFLDDVAELAFTVQAKLLQLLQSKQYYPLGAAQPMAADVRIIAASNVDLRLAVSERRFREDLFYRLQVLPVHMPTLAERRGDVPALAAHFCNLARERHKLPHVTLSLGALRMLEQMEWPGNIRQLAHAVEVGAIRAAGEGALRVERRHLGEEPGAPEPDSAHRTFQEATRRFQGEFLRDILNEHGWNIAETAKRLDLARSHVYNLIHALGLERPRPR
jgi:Nif-specific regulatory protein